MGNIDEKRLSSLLERINQIKEDLESLENEVREILTAAESTVASGPAADTEQVSVTEPTEVTDNSAADEEPIAIDDTPIDIEIPSIDIPPVIEDPTAAYEQPATQVTEHTAVTEPAEVTEETEPKDVQDIPDIEKDQDASGASTNSATEATKDIEADTKPEPKPGNDDLPFDDDLPMDFQEPEPQPIPEPKPVKVAKPKAAILDSSKAETAVMDVMAEKQAWRTDRPGSQVKNVISAISLNDRVLLINVLFREDPILFQNTINAFNGMSSLNEAISYIQTNFPDWDMNSEPVYRLMMAVRRKLS